MRQSDAFKSTGYTLPEAATLLGVSVKYIRKLRDEGRITIMRVAGRLRVPVSEVQKFLAENRFIEKGKTAKEIAVMVGCSAATIRRRCPRSRLAIKTRKGWRVARDKVIQFISILSKEA